MEFIVDEVVDPIDLKKFEKQYNEQVLSGFATNNAQFEYSWCLIRSKYQQDMTKGLTLLEDLFRRTSDEIAKRDYLYYLAVGCTRLKDYEKGLKYVNGILEVEPNNTQARALQQLIKARMKKDGLIGMAVIGGAAAVAVGGIAALIGLAVSKKS